MPACVLREHPRVPDTADCDSNSTSDAHTDSSSPAFIDLHTTPHSHTDH
jgi:hypothetical protein